MSGPSAPDEFPALVLICSNHILTSCTELGRIRSSMPERNSIHCSQNDMLNLRESVVVPSRSFTH
jgi:hypothetical protein